jgi:hypothetical protein
MIAGVIADVPGVCLGVLVGGWCGWYAAYHGKKPEEKA